MLLEDLQSTLVEVKLLRRNVQIPVDHLHKKALELIDVGERNAADLRDELVGVVCVIEHLARDQNGRQDEPTQSEKK